MKPLRGARHGARPLTAPSTAALRKLRLASQRSAENSIGTSEESSIGIDNDSSLLLAARYAARGFLFGTGDVWCGDLPARKAADRPSE